MVKNIILLIFKAGIFPALFSFNICFGQGINIDKDKLKLNISLLVYDKAKTEIVEGNYELKNYYLPAFRFGLDYELKNFQKSKLYTGVYIDLLPLFKFSFKFFEQDIEEEYQGNDWESYQNWVAADFNKSVLTINLFYSFKLINRHNLIVGIEGGILRSGSFSFSNSYTKENNESIHFFQLEAETQPFWLMPSGIVGIERAFEKWGKELGIRLLYRKSFVNYFKGNYRFFNLLSSPNTLGQYKFSGDFISIGLTYQLKAKDRK